MKIMIELIDTEEGLVDCHVQLEGERQKPWLQTPAEQVLTAFLRGISAQPYRRVDEVPSCRPH